MRITVLVVLFAATVAAQSSNVGQGAQPQTPVFRSSVEALVVEASVLDRDGKPVTDLNPNDFVVTLDGKPRRVRDARFFGDGNVEVVTRQESPVPGPVTQSSEDGRIVVFVIDRDSIAPGNEKVVLDAASRVLDGLRPADAAGVLTLPGDRVHLSRNRVLVRNTLSHLTGTRPRVMQSRDYNLTWDEALAFDRHDNLTIDRVIERECADVRQPNESMRNPCPPELQNYAREFLLTARFRTQSVLANLTSLAKQLAPMRGPKQIVFLSGGFPFGQDLLPEYDRFAAQAAEAQITFYAVHLDGAGADVTIAKQTQASPFGGRDFANGMGTVATMTGGAFFSAGGSAQGLFDRVRTEMNNFYELAVEMEGNDRAAASLEINVKVSRPGLTIRNRRRVLPPARLAANTSADPLSDLIQQPVDVGQMPIALSAYTMRGDDASTLRTIVGIETGSLLNDGPAEWAFAAFSEGNLVASGRQKLEGGTGPWAAALSAKLLPGQYQLRAAVRDHAGRAGVVERLIDVGLRGDARLQFSDLLIGVADASGRLQPLSQIPQGGTMSALFEVVSADAATLEKVKTTLELIPGGTATPVKKFIMGERPGTSAAIVNNQAEIPTVGLAPGRYTAIATAMIDSVPQAKVSRIFEIVQK